ncbi:MAG TPA: hypothetical protein VJT49_28395 [Amycolatopsis sp.]|uniref:hypothetical protein n=1 Tax=Amycolatopsis sp. TaxID=37632 RepID=UPI002B479FA9|nr:hypothetical protein [Amycolatopsis sp.]HKS48958.1 hypothetical protein [Amycolatopsis sp.]
MTTTEFPTTVPTERYRPRRMEPLGVVERASWTIKVGDQSSRRLLARINAVTAAETVTKLTP